MQKEQPHMQLSYASIFGLVELVSFGGLPTIFGLRLNISRTRRVNAELYCIPFEGRLLTVGAVVCFLIWWQNFPMAGGIIVVKGEARINAAKGTETRQGEMGVLRHKGVPI